MEERAQKQREEARREETIHLAEKGVTEKCARIDRSDREMDTESGGEAGISQSHSRHKKGHMTNIYLTDSDDMAIVDFVKAHEELSTKYQLSTSYIIQEKARTRWSQQG